MGTELLNWITWCAVALGVIGAAATIPMGDWVLTGSVAIGAAIAVLNLIGLRRLGRRLIATGGTRKSATVLFLLKFVFLIAAIWVLFTIVPINLFGVMGGLSVVVLAVLLGTLFGPVPDAGEQEDGEAVSGVIDG